MKCEYCNGNGVIINDALRRTSCPVCGGKGDIEQTNEEWFDTLSTEEKADFFCTVQNCLTIYGDHIATHEDWVKWLKEPHKE